MFNFTLTKDVFLNEDEYYSCRKKAIEKEITVQDIRLYIKNDIVHFWNGIISYFNFNGRNAIGTGAIFPHEMFDKYINNHCEDKNRAYKLLQICKQNGLLGIFSCGYTIESEKIEITDEEYQKLMDLIWNHGM